MATYFIVLLYQSIYDEDWNFNYKNGMELKLHHLINSRSQRILWLLEELQLDYELIIHPQKVLNADAPPHKFPTLLLQQSGHKQTLTESSAIAAYLCQQKQALILKQLGASLLGLLLLYTF